MKLGHVSDLENAIVLAENAIKATPVNNSELPHRLHNLQNALWDWYIRLNHLDDIN